MKPENKYLKRSHVWYEIYKNKYVHNSLK